MICNNKQINYKIKLIIINNLNKNIINYKMILKVKMN